MSEKLEEETEKSQSVLKEATLFLKERIQASPSLKNIPQNTILPQLGLSALYAKTELNTEFLGYDTPTVISGERPLLPQKKTNALAAQDDSSWSSSSTQWQYTVEEEIARGGMGVIFRGHQVVLNREVALKTLLPETVDLSQREHFIEESKITAYLDHPNIVPVYDLGINDTGETILVMKMIRGVSWRSLMQQYPPQEYLEKHLEILLQVCNATAFAHSKKIVHNDLKPENVMVGEFGEVFVMDWGIATSIAEPTETNLFRVHKQYIDSARGTPLYMPPELAEGRGADIGTWTDVYLLGGILYEILSGHPPHEGETLTAVIHFILTQTPKELPATVANELKQVCMKALAKPIKERYACVSEFKEALQKFLKHQESFLISEDASKLLEECKVLQSRYCHKSTTKEDREILLNGLYEKYAEAIAGFRQALKLCNENETSKEGQWIARFEYAKTALYFDDFGLAEMQRKQIPAERTEHLQLTTIIKETQETKLVQSISQRVSLIHLLVLLTLLPETFLAFGIGVYFRWSGQNTIAGRTLGSFGIYYPTFQFVNTLVFLSISIFFYRLFKRRCYCSNTFLFLTVLYQVFGVYFLSLSCLIVMQSDIAKIGSIYLCGIWIILFPLLFPYSTKLSFIGSGLAASSLFLVFATLFLFDFEFPEFDTCIILVIGYYFFAFVGGLLGCRKQQIYGVLSNKFGL